MMMIQQNGKNIEACQAMLMHISVMTASDLKYDPQGAF